MTVPNQVVLRARDRARGLRKPHNTARRLFITELLGALAAAEARALGRELDPEDVPYARARLWDEPPVRAALDALWPFLTPQRLVAGLLAEEGALRRAAPGLSAAERSALLRPGHPDAWTVADVPLLDEAAQLLGADDTADKRRRRALDRERRRRPLLGADARPVREGPLARGAAHRQLPHPDRDHGPGRRRAGRGRPRREPARVRPRGGRGAACGPGSRRRSRRGEGRARG